MILGLRALVPLSRGTLVWLVAAAGLLTVSLALASTLRFPHGIRLLADAQKQGDPIVTKDFETIWLGDDLIFANGFQNHPPSVDAGTDRAVAVNRSAILNGTGNDDDGNPLQFTWRIVAQPAGSSISLSNAQSPTPSFFPTVLGAYTFELMAFDGTAFSAPDAVTLTVLVPPVAVVGANQVVRRGAIVQLDGTGSHDPGGLPLAYAWSFAEQPDGTPVPIGAPTAVHPTFASTLSGLYRAQLVVSNGLIASDPAVMEVVALPPPPAEVAPATDPTVVTTVGESTAFLYDSTDPVQTGIPPGTINGQRAAVLRGKVIGRDSLPVAGVTVKVLGRPEYGQTVTQLDGLYDLAVNGGELLVLDLGRTGYLPVQRRIDVGWNGLQLLSDAVMIRPDSQPTRVELASIGDAAVVRGETVRDAHGERRGTLLLPSKLQAQMRLPNGQRRALGNEATFRVTEYTVGPLGPITMPGELPSTTSYTYAVELSIDEAMDAGATRVDFDTPLPFYVENFLHFPVGSAVPLGYYDRELAEWVPASNGRIIKILSISGRDAILDVRGNGVAATPAELQELFIDSTELRRLGALYGAGQELWRVRVDHFTPWDLNWPRLPPPGAREPLVEPPISAANSPSTSPSGAAGQPAAGEEPNACGSVIQCQKQTLQKDMAITGTPYGLHYSSERIPGWLANTTLEIPLSGPSVPSSLKRIESEIRIAGRNFSQAFGAAPNQRRIFSWDGKDAYGRPLSGAQDALVRTGYVYDAQYASPGAFQAGFATLSGVPISGNIAREEITFWQENNLKVGGPRVAAAFGLGGWSLTPHHFYDPSSRTLYQGDGELRVASAILSALTVTGLAGTGATGASGDGGPAAQALLNNPRGIAAGADGSLYIADSFNHRVRRIGTDGRIRNFAGDGTDGFAGDGSSALTAKLFVPVDVAVARDGSVFIADSYNHRIRKVLPNGTIRTVAGTGVAGFGGDGTSATAAKLNFPSGIAVGPSGDLYIADSFNHRVRRVGANGVITTIAGTGTAGFGGDAGPAQLAQLQFPVDIDVSSGGDVFIVDSLNQRIRKVDSAGRISTIAGTGESGFSGDGGQALLAKLSFPRAVTALPDNGIAIVDGSNRRVRLIDARGVISTWIGGGGGTFNNGIPAAQLQLQFPSSVVRMPDGGVVVADSGSQRLFVATRFLPRYSSSDLFIASHDGAELYRFGTTGRHLSTINAFTAAETMRFGYDPVGRLSTLTDGDGNVTTVERNASGIPTAIIAPDGQRTSLILNSDGFLGTLRNPLNESYVFGYTPLGLLTSSRNPRMVTSTYDYDGKGRLKTAADPAGGGLTLARTETGEDYNVTRTSALGRVTRYEQDAQANGDQSRQTVFPDASRTRADVTRDGLYTSTLPDGVVLEHRVAPDPRFGLQSAFASASAIRTGSRTRTVTATRQVTLAQPSDPLSLQTLSESWTLNGRTSRMDYAVGTKTWSSRSAGNRLGSIVTDSQGRPLTASVTGLAPINVRYDPRGRLVEIKSGSGPDERVTSYAYGPDGYIASITDPMLRRVQFTRDALGRVKQAKRPDDKVIEFDYDAAGNLSSLQPPERPAHGFAYTPINLVDSYQPPAVTGSGNTNSIYAYNVDRQLTSVTRADGRMVTYGYDTFGRPDRLTIARGSYQIGYMPSTGQVASIAAPGGVNLAYSYDGGLLTQTAMTGPVAGTVEYGYDNDFRINSLRVNGVNPISFGYDDDSLLTSAGALSLTYDPGNGLLTGTTLGSLTDSYSYNTFGEVVGYSSRFGSTVQYQVSYIRDKLGRISSKTETVLGIATTYGYRYDLAGRLDQVTTNGVITATYTYDANGNRLSRVAPGSTSAGTYDNQDRMLTYGGATYTYTADGELRTRVANGQTTTYDYDEQGNLISVVQPNSTTISYRVDGQDRRIGKLVNGTLVQGFLYQDQLAPIAELGPAGKIIARFIYGDRSHIPAYMLKGGQSYRFITDQLGSVRLVVQISNGQVVQRIDYDEFGRVTTDTNPGFQPFIYAGGIYDQDSRLTRFGVRDYSAEIGRWTTPDPISFGGGDTNLYAYVSGNPVNSIDPQGLCDCSGILERARESNNDSEYGFNGNKGAGLGQSKCNAYVHDVLSPTGVAPRRWLGLGGPISAGTWGDASKSIANFPIVSVPRPGDVVAIKYGRSYGHVAFVDAPGKSSIGAGPPGSHTTGWPWDKTLVPQGDPVYRRCSCK